MTTEEWVRTRVEELNLEEELQAMKTVVQGPLGEYRVELQDDDQWSVEEIISASAELTGTKYVAAFSAHRMAVTYARLRAGLPEFEPLPDRRGAIEHTKAKSC